MSALNLVVFENDAYKNRLSSGETVDFTAIRLGVSNLLIKETAGQIDVGAVRVVNAANAVGDQDLIPKLQVESYVAGQVSGFILSSEKGAANGVATLDGSTKVPNAQLGNVLAGSISNGDTTHAPTGDAVFDALAGKSDVGHTHTASEITDFTAAARAAAVEDQIVNGVSGIAPSQNAVFDALALKINLSEKGANNGVATLDSGGKVPVTQLPFDIMQYIGTWDASSNTPSLSDYANGAAAGEHIGDFYRVSAAGTVDFGSGNIHFEVGDWAVVNVNGKWEHSPGTSAVTSVNGQSGVVVLDSDDISEGSTNLYYTAARFNSAFAAKSTTDLAEGTNLYYTAARFNTAFAAKSTNDLSEGVSGLYFTDERAQDAAAAMFTDTSTIDFTYSDGANQMAADVKAASITASHIAGSAVGNGLVGGAGTAIAVSAGDAIKVGSTVAVDFAKSFVNDNAGTVSVRQVVYIKSNGHVDLARADVAALYNFELGLVEDATILTTATGKVTVRRGAIVGGFSGLTPGKKQYVSRATAGVLVESSAGFVAGEQLYQVGRAISATEILFDPMHIIEM